MKNYFEDPLKASLGEFGQDRSAAEDNNVLFDKRAYDMAAEALAQKAPELKMKLDGLSGEEKILLEEGLDRAGLQWTAFRAVDQDRVPSVMEKIEAWRGAADQEARKKAMKELADALE